MMIIVDFMLVSAAAAAAAATPSGVMESAVGDVYHRDYYNVATFLLMSAFLFTHHMVSYLRSSRRSTLRSFFLGIPPLYI